MMIQHAVGFVAAHYVKEHSLGRNMNVRARDTGGSSLRPLEYLAALALRVQSGKSIPFYPPFISFNYWGFGASLGANWNH